jgi:phage/plasmid-associated DNA primase
MMSVNIDKYLEETKLINFCNQNNRKDDKVVEKHHYSVDKDRTTLPCYQMTVVNIENVGKKHVYDINVEEPYSNFVAEGIVTHNCNKLPRLRFNLKATWNRLRVIPFEAVFIRPNDPEGVPDTYEEQLRQKRFPMDKNFSQKIPGMLEAFAWVLLEHRKTITIRIEPEKVRAATAVYRRQNDKFREFSEENIIEDKKSVITLSELYAQFREWFRESMPGHSLPIKKEIEDYFTKLWGETDRGKKWEGYRIRTLADDVEDGSVVILEEEDLVDYDGGTSNLPDL